MFLKYDATGWTAATTVHDHCTLTAFRDRMNPSPIMLVGEIVSDSKPFIYIETNK